MKKTSNHCPRCGRWAGDVLCQCRVNEVMRATREDEQVKLCLKMAEQNECKRERLVAEVACVVEG